MKLIAFLALIFGYWPKSTESDYEPDWYDL